MTSAILYISYDGMLEPLGQSQVFSYLKRLSVERQIYLISFEKVDDWSNINFRNHLKQEIESAGIIWYPLRYHKWPSSLATAWDIILATILGFWLINRYKIRIVHARSYVPSVIALSLQRLTKIKFIFDMRGFWADERVDGGLWSSHSILFKLAKRFEKSFLLSADHVVSLTKTAANEIKNFKYLNNRSLPLSVIPTCADLECFTPLPHKRVESNFVLGYVGSVGTWYLFDEVLNCFSELLIKYPNAILLIINKGQHSFIRERLAIAGIPESSIKLNSVIHSEVPQQMNKMNAGIFFYRPSFSRLACAPTKLGEFLGCGVPCLTNTGVGDMADVIEIERVGIAINSFDKDSISIGLSRLLNLVFDPDTRGRCVSAAQKNFSLNEGVSAYNKIYSSLCVKEND